MLTVNREPAILGFERIRGVDVQTKFGRRAMDRAIRCSARPCKSILAGLSTFLLTGDTPKCKKRDGDRCILTKAGDPQVAHIFPYSMLDTPPSRKKRNNLTESQNVGAF
jgi:hypothetical protein